MEDTWYKEHNIHIYVCKDVEVYISAHAPPPSTTLCGSGVVVKEH